MGRLNGVDGKELEDRISRLLEKTGMTAAADQKVSTYSRGMRQRLGIADVLMKDPKVIIMDEPTLGLDPEGVRELMELIRSLAADEHRTVLISSHQLYQIQQVCDRAGIFVEGRLIHCGTIRELGAGLGMEGSSLDDIYHKYFEKEGGQS
jgi:ABC-2 type transport system ATP-binding protein